MISLPGKGSTKYWQLLFYLVRCDAVVSGQVISLMFGATIAMHFKALRRGDGVGSQVGDGAGADRRKDGVLKFGSACSRRKRAWVGVTTVSGMRRWCDGFKSQMRAGEMRVGILLGM